MLAEFKKLIMHGNVIDMAVGIVIGVAFGAIVNSLVNDILMPPVGLLLGNVDFRNLYINLSGGAFATLADAQKAGAVTINYGVFINTLISFIILAAVVFFIIKWLNRVAAEPAAPAGPPTTKDCPYCYSTIPIKASRCPNCTSELKNLAP